MQKQRVRWYTRRSLENSQLVKTELYFFLRSLWQSEEIPKIILTLDQLVQTIDTGGEGIRVDTIGKLCVLGYTDDVDMMERTVEVMTLRLTKFADESMTQADMKVKLSKTFDQIVQRVTTSTWESNPDRNRKQREKYKFKCPFEGCSVCFKTKNGMLIHRASCACGYSLDHEWKFCRRRNNCSVRQDEPQVVQGVVGKLSRPEGRHMGDGKDALRRRLSRGYRQILGTIGHLPDTRLLSGSDPGSGRPKQILDASSFDRSRGTMAWDLITRTHR